MSKYRLVNNHDYAVSGVYYSGRNKKYSDIFSITTKEFAKVYTDKEDAVKDQQMLSRRFGYLFEIEEE